jgi:hypothetical protein
LQSVLAELEPPGDQAARIRARFAPLGGVALDLAPREETRVTPKFE